MAASHVVSLGPPPSPDGGSSLRRNQLLLLTISVVDYTLAMDPVNDQAQANTQENPEIEVLPPPPAANEICDNIISDPPPPYPSGRTRRTRASRRHQGRLQPIHTQISSIGSLSDHEQGTEGPTSSSGPSTEEDDGERSPFLTTTNSGLLRNPGQRRRPRSLSHASTMSAAPSLAHTILSLFEQEDDEDTTRGPIHLPEDGLEEGHMHSFTEDHDGESLDLPRRNAPGFTTVAGWKQYFVPLARPMFYRSLAHLLFINFPYALAAWVYLFVFTVSGSVLLIALPLGALLCFLDLLGARAFARGELYLQTTFHSPLSYPSPYPPRPIFTRYREATNQEIESGYLASGRTGLVRERSFYKNTYAMFTDPTSYQALFYFIVIKPAITIILLLFALIFVIPSIILVLPAPAALRATRKLGRWQANIAVEGLYHAVRAYLIFHDSFDDAPLFPVVSASRARAWTQKGPPSNAHTTAHGRIESPPTISSPLTSIPSVASSRSTQSPQANVPMSKYALPDVVYRGYIMPSDRFTEMMNQIPEHKWVYDNAGYAFEDHIYRYVYWKKGELNEDLRIRAPRIKEHREVGVSLSDPPTHIMILTSYIKARRPDLVKEPKKLLETENDRKSIEATVKFFRSQSANDVKVEDFEFTCSVGCNPKLITT
ncbi:hypothetical protein NMY22_g14152 [Coprinellus aureogranulatus]|nr:hypothetical protein NMY22_g14152 [Coprinellus aureogranulatus]